MTNGASALRDDALQARVALVTGVGRRVGIGFAIARRLAQAGADLFLQSLARAEDPGGIEPLIRELRAFGHRVEYAEADFAHPKAPNEVIRAAAQAYIHIDILVANHAFSTMGGLEAMTAEQIDRHLAVNARGTLLLIQGFAAQHNAKRRGSVIIMSSGQGMDPMPGELAYVASKAAIEGLTLSLSDHLIRRGITVNAVDPGATDTGYATRELHDAVARASPQGRWGDPDDAARLIAWLATDDARWITGQVIHSRGGS